jgi:hypothetical protein
MLVIDMLRELVICCGDIAQAPRNLWVRHCSQSLTNILSKDVGFVKWRKYIYKRL